MTKVQRHFRNLLDAESMEPSLTWGLRMAVATTVPVVWGIATGHIERAEWIALTADCIGWIALKGRPGQRFQILVAGILLTFLFTLLGTLTATSIWMSIVAMIFVAFLAGLFKNLGERGSGLSLCLYVMFLIANAAPAHGPELEHRLISVLIGGVWNAALGMATVFFIPVQMPYRRAIALVWRSTASLMETIAKGWDGKGVRSTQRELYLAERVIRDALDSSFAFYEKSVHQLKSKEEGSEFQLAQVRKAAALFATTIIAISEELERLRLNELDEDLRLRLASLLHTSRLSAVRMAMLALSRRAEDELLVQNSLEELSQKISLMEHYKGLQSIEVIRIIRRVILLSERCQKLVSRSMVLLGDLSESSLFRSYSLVKTVYVLHPRHWLRSIRLLFNLDSHTTRYAVRTAVAAGIAMFLDKIFDLERGYWLPLTVIIIMQPYFSATLRKALDRLIGTIAGGIAGGLVLRIPGELHIKELMLFLSAVAMVHFFRTRYRVSAFFITLNLVLLFSVSHELNKGIIFWRAGLTLAGAVIAVLTGFALLPAWDKKYLPRFAALALGRNWEYFQNSFSARSNASLRNAWTKYKRLAEVDNSNAFDSFNRAMQEPGGLKKEYKQYYQLITHNMRVTRELNNFHLEQEARNDQENLKVLDPGVQEIIQKSLVLFKEILAHVAILGKNVPLETTDFIMPEYLPAMNTAQKIYLERLLKELEALRDDILVLNGERSFNEALVT